ncbi:ribose pyranase [Corynebacterium glutamicum]|uniref:D-ribose pyranase n=2 Tax=Corynebacterium glutamicum TaxID=1718 RepID=RBSD_CORGB|nr:D-ribose pyranase [Corynebacterium glutamicum]A4QDL6.1 RecName: Full=D-ribose pyranase [Corynebacterium glutamicum R]AGN18996.1 D-ribose pyranase [Corynebacterium glutamicum SCgG1]AGN22019.1 D-ribose pyranase [Corynebacterium glutamicum SCgG2]AIK84941.1 ribose pyranase [Corynebacterium glutamicum]AIK87725.1 ribose pyranase [Corynebacterium glutamicum]EGV41305.1 D-ribose pyranase [Corynebacterium glutamicum S9114]
MKKSGLLNPDLCYAIARLGHTDTWAVADCGLPIPEHVEIIDLALVFGIPTFEQVLNALKPEVVVEGAVIAEGTPERIREMVDTDVEVVTHEELKAQLAECAFVIRTGETTAYANVIFKSGVAF